MIRVQREDFDVGVELDRLALAIIASAGSRALSGWCAIWAAASGSRR